MLVLLLTGRENTVHAPSVASFDNPISDDYDIMPYAYADSYDKIQEASLTDQDIPIQFPKREGPLPTPGYDKLLSQANVPTVYLPIDNYEQPIDREDIRLNPDLMPEFKQYSDIGRSCANEPNVNTKLPAYIQLIGETEEEYSSRTLSTFSAELKEINRSSVMSSDSVNDIPSSYLRINEDDAGGVKGDGFDPEEISSSYLKIIEDGTNEDSRKKIHTHENK